MHARTLGPVTTPRQLPACPPPRSLATACLPARPPGSLATQSPTNLPTAPRPTHLPTCRLRPGGRWNYTDTTLPSPSFKTYSHWGTDNTTGREEPNGPASAACGVANYTQEYGGSWGWSDTPCGQQFVHICRIMRKWRLARVDRLARELPAACACGRSGCHWPGTSCSALPCAATRACSRWHAALAAPYNTTAALYPREQTPEATRAHSVLSWSNCTLMAAPSLSCAVATSAAPCICTHQTATWTTHPPSTPPPHAAPGRYPYFSNTSNLTYVLNTYNQTAADSNAECRQSGGSLVTFRSLAQQEEVEQLYVSLGLLFPLYHRVRRLGWGMRQVHECLSLPGRRRGSCTVPTVQQGQGSRLLPLPGAAAWLVLCMSLRQVQDSSPGCHELSEAAHRCPLCAQNSLQCCSTT